MASKRSPARAGTTRNVSVSLSLSTLASLRARAESTHGGNLSAAIAEAAEVLQRQTARQAVSRALMRGRPPLSDADRAAIDAELEEGWSHARRHKKRTRAA
jgi:hypothetical protein